VREAEVDYYTDAITYTKVRILDRFAEEPRANARRNHGDVHVTEQVVGFKKIKFHTNENVGAGELTMPENEMHTTAYWLTIPREVMQTLPFTREERRDGVVALSYTLGQLAALFLMCDRHDLGVALGDDGQGEARVERGLLRAGYASRSPEPLPPPHGGSGGAGFTPALGGGGPGGAGAPPRLDRGAGVTPAPREDITSSCNVFVYDAYPGGMGLSEPLFRLHDRLLTESRALIAACGCREGCPSCVGPAGEIGSRGKEVALVLLDAILGA
jgi:DEAD/DEAH box helicase domain-containing protein